MRRAWLKNVPALRRIYGIHPWELEDYTPAELDEINKDIAENNRRAKQAEADRRRHARGGRRGR